jgi:hypothetical protein
MGDGDRLIAAAHKLAPPHLVQTRILANRGFKWRWNYIDAHENNFHWNRHDVDIPTLIPSNGLNRLTRNNQKIYQLHTEI